MMAAGILWGALAMATVIGAYAALRGGARRRRAITLVDLGNRVAQLERDLRASCAAQARAGDRLIATERELRRIAGGQSRLEMRAPAGGSYRQAVSLASHGADIDELIESCGLTRAEAELLGRVHGGQASQGGRGAADSITDRQADEAMMIQ